MKKTSKKISAFFFKSDTGKQPVKELILSLADSDKKIIGEDIKTIEFGWPIGMPVAKSLGKGLYEVRSSLTDGSKARILFTIYKNQMILLHGFIKKTLAAKLGLKYMPELRFVHDQSFDQGSKIDRLLKSVQK